MKLHNIKIVQKGPKNKIMTGANTKVLIDGKEAKGLTELSFKVVAAGIAEVSMKFLASTEVDCYAHIIGQYSPVRTKKGILEE